MLGTCFGFVGCNEQPAEETPLQKVEGKELIAQYANLYGRDFYNENFGGWCFYNAASGFEFCFYGTSFTVDWQSIFSGDNGKSEISVFVDGETDSEARVETIGKFGTRHVRKLLENLKEGEHTVKVLKRHASRTNSMLLFGAETDGHFLSAPLRPNIKIEVFGDSITAGEGVMRPVVNGEATGGYTAYTQNALKAYAYVAAQKIGAEVQIFGRGGAALYYANPGENCIYENHSSIALDISKEDYPYDYSSYTPDAVVIYLGTNDFNFGTKVLKTYTPEGMRSYMKKFIREVIGANYGTNLPVVLCYGMMVPTSGLDEVMEGVKQDLLSEFPKIATASFAATPYGHPVEAEDEAAAEILAGVLREKLGL